MGGKNKASSSTNHRNGQVTAKVKAVRGKKRIENREKKETQTLSSWNKSNIGYCLVVASLGKYHSQQ